MISSKSDIVAIGTDLGRSIDTVDSALSAPVDIVNSIQTTFSADENPFLFPLDLLTSAASLPAAALAAAPPVVDSMCTPRLESIHDDNRNHNCNDLLSFSPAPQAGSTATHDDPFRAGSASWNELDTPTWWLLHTKPRQEKKLAEHLARLEIPHFLPATKSRAVTRGRIRITRAPLFPGYFFLCGTAEQRLQALETNRLVATHRVNDGIELSNRLCELAELIEKGAPLTTEARLAAGKKVRVRSGTFKNIEGTVIKRSGKTRLFISVNEILGGVSLAIEEHLLEPLY